MKELDSITKLTESFKSFPSIGEKSAERMEIGRASCRERV